MFLDRCCMRLKPIAAVLIDTLFSLLVLVTLCVTVTIGSLPRIGKNGYKAAHTAFAESTARDRIYMKAEDQADRCILRVAES